MLSKFPSPIGDFVFSINNVPLLSYDVMLVSVPYRGFCFFNDVEGFLKILKEYGVSVPYRGFCFFNGQVYKKVKETLSEFPSPIGDFVFSIIG